MFKTKINQKGFSHHLLLPVVVIIIAAVGAFVLSKSHAATVPSLGFNNYNTVANYTSTGVFKSQDVVPGIGWQPISEIPPNKQLIYNYFPSKVVRSTQNCYYLRIYSDPKSPNPVTSAKVQIVSYGNSKVVTLPVSAKYYEVCVSSGTGT
jgi:hypothetical protein